jgi:hypothetical protein
MTFIHTSVAVITLAVASYALAGASDGKESFYYELIGIGCVPWQSDGSSLSWRQQSDGIDDGEAMNVFKYFEGPDTRRCLAQIINSTPGLASEARDLSGNTTEEQFLTVVASIRERWSRIGVGKALREVAETGHRGPMTLELLQRCKAMELEMDLQEQE